MRPSEWPTLLVLCFCYAAWLAVVAWADRLGWLAWPLLAVIITLFSSLQHEVVHGHPFRDRRLNAALVFPALNLFIAYRRFEATHLAHHDDANLTDPRKDPESCYCDPADWRRYGRLRRLLLVANNTLAGRLLLGPALYLWSAWGGDLRRIARGDIDVLRAWLWHLPALLAVLACLVALGTVSVWAYLVCCYAGLSLLMLRTFLEHQAHASVMGRVVIIEERGPLAFLFLNNNLHAVHHRHPGLPWYELPRVYRRNRRAFQALNHGYVYRSYAGILRAYAFRAKEAVPHPLLPVR